jgi:hypothetical protein
MATEDNHRENDVESAKRPRGVVPSRAARWLEHHGGYVLVAAGCVLVGLGVWRADKPAVAPILVLFGAAMILLGAFYSRIEGSVEATKDGVKAVVREVERVAMDQGLSPDEFAQLLTLALDRYTPESGRATQVLSSARRAAEDAAADPDLSPIALERRLASAVTAWLAAKGWTVEDYTTGGPDIGYDMLALKEAEQLLIELKSYRAPLPQQVIRRAAVLRDSVAKLRPTVRTAVVLSEDSPAPTEAGLRLARELEVELYRLQASDEPEIFAGPAR